MFLESKINVSAMKDEGYNTISIVENPKNPTTPPPKTLFTIWNWFRQKGDHYSLNVNQLSSPVDATFMGWLCIIYTWATTLIYESNKKSLLNDVYLQKSRKESWKYQNQ